MGERCTERSDQANKFCTRECARSADVTSSEPGVKCLMFHAGSGLTVLKIHFWMCHVLGHAVLFQFRLGDHFYLEKCSSYAVAVLLSCLDCEIKSCYNIKCIL